MTSTIRHRSRVRPGKAQSLSSALFGMLLGTVMLAGQARPALAAREAADEVGRWVGFAHQAEQFAPGSHVILNLTRAAGEAGRPLLQGDISGLPAVQRTLTVLGYVTPAGRLSMVLKGDGVTGFCDGSVRPIENFSPGSGQDDLGAMEYGIVDTAGHRLRGRINLLHLFGGAKWSDVRTQLLPAVQSQGAFIPAVQDHAGGAMVNLLGQQGSECDGSVRLADRTFDMVGTLNGRGSLVMMGDGSVVPGDNGGQHALIGLLFTGGVHTQTEPDQGRSITIVGHYGIGDFGELVPAVQKVREAALSLWWHAAL